MYCGYSSDSVLNVGLGTPLVTTKLNYGVNGYALPSIPVIQPYGFVGVAPDNSMGVYVSLGNNFTSVCVAGYTNTQEENSNLTGMVKGESAIFNSNNFTHQLKHDGAYDVFSGAAAKIKAAVINGSNTNQILIDLCAEIQAMQNFINNFVSVFNNHIHPAPNGNTGTPTVTEQTYNPTSNFNRDKNFLNENPNPNFINKNGKELS